MKHFKLIAIFAILVLMSACATSKCVYHTNKITYEDKHGVAYDTTPVTITIKDSEVVITTNYEDSYYYYSYTSDGVAVYEEQGGVSQLAIETTRDSIIVTEYPIVGARRIFRLSIR